MAAARLVLEGNQSPLELFGLVAATREPLNDPLARGFTVEDIGLAPLLLTCESLLRRGPI